MKTENIRKEIVKLIESHNSIINENQSFGAYIERCRRENINNEETIVQPFTISFLNILNYHNQQNLTIEEQQEGNKPDFHTKNFILECKSSKYKDFDNHEGRYESPKDQLIRYLKSSEFQRKYGILFSFDRFETYTLEEDELVFLKDLSFSLIDFFEGKPSNIDKFITRFYSQPLKQSEKIDLITKKERKRLKPINAKQFNKIVKSFKNLVALALIEKYNTLEKSSDEKGLIKNKICDIKRQLDLSQNLAEKEYISQTAFIYLARLILTKCWEDMEIIDPPNTYNGGFENYFKLTKGKIEDIFQIAINKSQNIYYLFDPNNPYLLIDLPESLILDIFLEFSKYDFKSLTYDILGYVYEDYLDKENRKNFGQYYTPPFIVNLILDRVGYIPKPNELLDKNILDPASGSGTFLLNAVKRIINSKKDGRDNSKEYKKVFETSIYGSELMLFPYLLSEINLLLQFSPIIKDLVEKSKKLNVTNLYPNNSFNLISKNYGSRLFDIKEDSIKGAEIVDPALTERKKIKLEKFKEKNNFDYVVGNPPYVSNDTNPELFQELKKKFTFCNKTYSNKMDLFYWFIILGILKLGPEGKLSYITTRYWLSKGEYTGVGSLKKFILDYCYVREIIDFQNIKIFSSARGQENIVFLIEKKSDKNQDQNLKIFEINTRPKINECRIEKCYFEKGFCENDEEYLECICSRNQEWDRLLKGEMIPLRNYINAYYSAKKTSDLKKNRSWDVFYQKGGIIDKIIKDLHESCTRIVKKESAITVTGEKILKEEEVELFIGDYFQIRSGITTIADEYFILTNEVLEKKDKILYLKIANTERLSIKQKEKLITEYNEIRNKLNKSEKEDENNFYFNEKGVLYLKITKNGKEKLKPTFKTPAIYRHGLDISKKVGKMIFFNDGSEIFNCPALLIYLRQYQKELKEKLKNYDEWTQERPYKWATIRRGGNVKLWNKSKKKNINTDLESFYDSANKIFFNYIMKTNNIFGFYEGPMVATSDMYFFHPAKRNINIYYILAYLNSKLMTFYFLNKPINIKRSKSNIENDVPVFIPRSENEKILFKSIIQTEKRVIKNFKKLEKEYRLLGFDFSLEPESPQSIKINFKTYFNKKNSKLPSLKDLSYEINDSTKIQKIDRDSFPILIDNPFNSKYFKEFQINDTILGDRLFRYKTLKIYCSKEKAHILERIIKNYDYFNQDKNTISDLMNHKFPDENLFKELANIKKKLYNFLRVLNIEEKAMIESLVEKIIKKGEKSGFEELKRINQFLYFIDYSFLVMAVPNHIKYILKNY